jgi:excisionase family DNA binding protein
VLRNHRHIPPYQEGERTERGEATLEEAAAALNVSEATVRRLIQEKILAATQHCKGAPWVIRISDLDDETVKRAAESRRQRRPPSADPNQSAMEL